MCLSVVSLYKTLHYGVKVMVVVERCCVSCHNIVTTRYYFIADNYVTCSLFKLHSLPNRLVLISCSLTCNYGEGLCVCSSYNTEAVVQFRRKENENVIKRQRRRHTQNGTVVCRTEQSCGQWKSVKNLNFRILSMG